MILDRYDENVEKYLCKTTNLGQVGMFLTTFLSQGLYYSLS